MVYHEEQVTTLETCFQCTGCNLSRGAGNNLLLHGRYWWCTRSDGLSAWAIPYSSYCGKEAAFCGSNDYWWAPVVSLMCIPVTFIVVVTTCLRERTTKERRVYFGSCFGGTVCHGRKGFSDRIMRQLPTLNSPFRSRER